MTDSERLQEALLELKCRRREIHELLTVCKERRANVTRLQRENDELRAKLEKARKLLEEAYEHAARGDCIDELYGQIGSFLMEKS